MIHKHLPVFLDPRGKLPIPRLWLHSESLSNHSTKSHSSQLSVSPRTFWFILLCSQGPSLQNVCLLRVRGKKTLKFRLNQMFCVSPLSLHPVRLNSGQYLWGKALWVKASELPDSDYILSTPRSHSVSLHPNVSLSWREHKCAGISISVLQIPSEPAGFPDLRVPLLYCYTPCSGFQTHEFWISSNFYLFSVGKRKSSTSCS